MKKSVAGYEGLYEIDDFGVVYTLGKFPKLRNKVIGPLKPGLSRGYLTVTLTDSHGKRSSILVHRLVAKNFLENKDGLRCVNHKDENKLNNSVDNLEWCTDQYNKEYSSRTSYTLISKDGEIVTTKNLSRFCRERGLQQGNMNKVTSKQRQHHRGWSLL